MTGPENSPPRRPDSAIDRLRAAFSPSHPRFALHLFLAALALGLLIALIWVLSRPEAEEFYRGEPEPAAPPAAVPDALPAPMPGEDLPASADAPTDAPTGTPAPEAEPEAPASVEPAPRPRPRPETPRAPPPEPSPYAGMRYAPPRVLQEFSRAPRYPLQALRRRDQGEVLLTVDVDSQGHVVAVDITRRSPSRALDAAAVNAVRDWRFAPAIRNGQPVPGRVQVPIEFTLDGR